MSQKLQKDRRARSAANMASGTDKNAAIHTMTKRTPEASTLVELSLSEASELIRCKKISPVELTRECLSRIEQVNPELNAFITVTADSALNEARQAESEIQQGNWRGPLHGIPVALKDIIDTAGLRTTGASGIHKDRVPTKDAEVVRRLKAAGAVFLGKLNLHEFAYGGSSAVSYFGPVRNPWNLEYSSGGSSGGSAAAVAAQLCFAAIGTDTGGSIRQPAACCGVIGLKPTYGRVSTSGIVPLSWSLDHVGPITRTAKDAAFLLQVIAGYDLNDPTSLNISVPDYVRSIAAPISSLRLGIPRAYFYETLDSEIQSAMEAALAILKTMTASQSDVPSLSIDDAYASWMHAYGLIFMAEAYACHKDFILESPERYQPATLKRLRAGSDIDAAAYIQSRRQLEHVRRMIAGFFEAVDLVITPTMPVPPFAIAELQGEHEAVRARELAMLHNTRPFNFAGLPSISVPCGFTRTGLPVGMQITGPPGTEATVLRLAHAYEQVTEWHKYKPNVD